VSACVKASGLSLLRSNRIIVDGLTFSADRGERIAVLGPNGSGKTTLARTFLGFSEYRGSLEIEGRDVRSDVKAARRAVAAVFGDADPQLLMPTVFDELAFSLKAAGGPYDPARVGDLAEKFGLEALLPRHPSRLSSGEKRRALLALNIGRKPSILILDEPTADLDVRGTRILRETLATLPQTIFLITHDYDLARAICRKTIVLAGGRTAVFENIGDLFADRALLESWELV
jgi:cobalt/nickel transport system ATP-binding protein